MGDIEQVNARLFNDPATGLRIDTRGQFKLTVSHGDWKLVLPKEGGRDDANRPCGIIFTRGKSSWTKEDGETRPVTAVEWDNVERFIQSITDGGMDNYIIDNKGLNF